jgi:hypothetical protein
MKKLIGLMAVLFMFAVPVAVVQAVELDDVTMQTMDANDDHASDITNEIELPEQADDHASAASESGDSNSASNEQEHEHEAEQEHENEQEMEHEDEHRDEVQDASHDEAEVEQHDNETQPESDN